MQGGGVVEGYRAWGTVGMHDVGPYPEADPGRANFMFFLELLGENRAKIEQKWGKNSKA